MKGKGIGPFFYKKFDEKELKPRDLAGSIGKEATQLYRLNKRKGQDIQMSFSIAHKMDIPLYEVVLQEFLDEEQLENFLYTQEQIRKLIRIKNYKEMGKFLRGATGNPDFMRADKTFFLWHQGIHEFHGNKDIDGALKIFDDIVKDDFRLDFERKMEVVNSKGVVFLDSGDQEQALYHYKKYQHYIFSRPLQDPQIRIRYLNNLSIAFHHLQDYRNAVLTCQQALHFGQTTGCYYMVGELHYQLGLSQYFLEDIPSAAMNMRFGAMFLQYEGRHDVVEYIRRKFDALGLGPLQLL